MFFKNDSERHRFFVPAGLLALTCSIMVGRFFGDTLAVAHFLEGLFLGLAFSHSVAGLIFAALARSYE